MLTPRSQHWFWALTTYLPFLHPLNIRKKKNQSTHALGDEDHFLIVEEWGFECKSAVQERAEDCLQRDLTSLFHFNFNFPFLHKRGIHWPAIHYIHFLFFLCALINYISYSALQLDVALQLNSSQWDINGNDTDYFLVSPIKSSLTYSSMLFSFLWLYTEYHSLLYVVEDGGALGWKEQFSWITPPRKPIHCSGTLILDYK